MMDFDESIPEELNIHLVFGGLWQLPPVRRVTRIQIQIQWPPIIEVVLQIFAEVGIEGLFAVEFCECTEKHLETLSVARLLGELSKARKQVAKFTHDVAEDRDAKQHDERHDESLHIRPRVIVTEADRRQSGESKVHTRDALVRDRTRVKRWRACVDEEVARTVHVGDNIKLLLVHVEKQGFLIELLIQRANEEPKDPDYVTRVDDDYDHLGDLHNVLNGDERERHLVLSRFGHGQRRVLSELQLKITEVGFVDDSHEPRDVQKSEAFL